MSKYKYNLLGFNLPEGYRFVKRGERYNITDIWWNREKGLDKNDIYGHDDAISGVNWPIETDGSYGFGGWVRKIK